MGQVLQHLIARVGLLPIPQRQTIKVTPVAKDNTVYDNRSCLTAKL